jgi:hypothetical protein
MAKVVWAALLLVALTIVPALCTAQVGTTQLTDPAQVRARLVAAASIEGKITDVRLREDEKIVVVEYLHVIKRQPDPIAARKVDFLKPAYDKAVESKFQPLIDKLGEALMKAQKEASGIEEMPIPFVCRIEPETKLRTLAPLLDDNGKPKKLSSEELKQLKGDPRLPGLMADVDQLAVGGKVQFTIDKVKFRPPAKTKDKAGEGDKVVYPLSMLVIAAPPKFDAKDNPFLPAKK